MGPSYRMRSLNPDSEAVHFDDILDLCQRSPDLETTSSESTTTKRVNETSGEAKALFRQLADLLGEFQGKVANISEFAHLYDSKIGVKANGYRSSIRIANRFINMMTESLVAMDRTKIGKSDLGLLSCFVAALEKLILLYGFIVDIHKNCASTSSDYELFPEAPDVRHHGLEELSREIAYADFSVFYGRIAGFHYRGDCKHLAKPMVHLMSSFSDVYDQSWSKKIRNILHSIFGIRYVLDPDSLAKKVFEEARRRPVGFCKDFFGLSEMELLYKDLSILRTKPPQIKTNYVFKLPPEKMKIMNTQGAAFQVPVPSSYLGSSQGVQVRFISPFRTPNMIGACPCGLGWSGNCSCQIVPSSDTILFHLHGGGFVSQTSKSHLPYLKRWCRSLGVPILSIDYSLAPEAPFPRACEEVLFAYCWMRNNFESLGTTGHKVIIGGDSAGGNLSAGLVLQCIQHSLPKPDVFFGVYPSLLCQMYPSPSRLVCMMDPFVMFGYLLRCLNAYAESDYQQTCPRSFDDEVESTKNHHDPLLSPLLIPKDLLGLFPPTYLVSTDLDPCLDETVAFSSKLHTSGVQVKLEVFSGLPHGFLSLSPASRDCSDAVEYIQEKLRDFIVS